MEPSAFSPTDSGEEPGHPAPGMRYRRQSQRRFSMEVRGSRLHPLDVAVRVPRRAVALEPDFMGSNPSSAVG